MLAHRFGAALVAGLIPILGTLVLGAASSQATDGLLVAPSSQPLNVGDAIIAATAYHDSAAYEREIAAITATAAAWINEVAPSTHKPAIVLDVDETALSNWTIIKRDDFGRPIGGPCPVDSTAPCGWAAWDMLASDTVIAPVLDLVSKARALGVKVFFITGRPESQRTATEKNLRAAGYIDFETLYMAPNAAHFASAADFKTPVRAAIETEGYTIIANIGDQPSDLYGGHAEKIFLLPNPFYRVP